MTTLIISNNELEDIIEIVKSLEGSGLLLKGVTETVQNEVKEQKGGFLSMLLGTLGANLLENILAGKGATATRQGRGINIAGKGRGISRAGEETVRSGYGNKKGKEKQQNGFLMLPLPLTNFEMQKYYQNKPRFNGAYSRDNLSKIKDGAYVIKLDEYSDIGTYWNALYFKNNNVTYFDNFGVEHIPKEIKTFIKNKNIKTNIFRIQTCNSIMCRYFCIGFIDFMFKGKTLIEDINLFSPNNFKKNDDMILYYFINI